MSKGTRREREAKKLYERAGYWVYSPQNPKYGDNDLWNLFDLAAFRVTTADIRLAQVKSNGARGINAWCHLARHFTDVDGVQADFVIPYDSEGWRLDQPADDGHTTVYDERDDDRIGPTHHSELAIGDGLAEVLAP